MLYENPLKCSNKKLSGTVALPPTYLCLPLYATTTDVLLHALVGGVGNLDLMHICVWLVSRLAQNV